MTFVDPPEPPEAGGLKAKDLKGQVVILRPESEGEWPAKTVEENGKQVEKAAQPYIECYVWVLDRMGVTEESAGVRIGWWRAVDQLRGLVGQYVAAKVVENDDRSVTLTPLTGDAREVAGTVMKEITGPSPVPGGSDPF